jgi:UrcA family protein
MHNVTKSVLAIGLFAAAFAAVAGESPTVQSRNVHYGDLNLESQQGVAQLYSRLSYAARRVCSDGHTWSGAAQKSAESKCIHNAIANAVSKVNKPQLTAFYRTKNGSKEQQSFSQL